MKIKVEVDGDLTAGLDRLVQQVADDVIYSGAAAMARVMYAEVQLNTSGVKENFPGVVTGNLRNSIYWARNTDLSRPGLAVYSISYNKSKAPHGHLLEFGTSRAPAHPFMRPAMARMDDAIKAGLARMRERYGEAIAGQAVAA